MEKDYFFQSNQREKYRKTRQPFLTANKCKQTKANVFLIKSRRTRFCENYSLCASHHSVELIANWNCTLSKFLKNTAFILQKICQAEPARLCMRMCECVFVLRQKDIQRSRRRAPPTEQDPVEALSPAQRWHKLSSHFLWDSQGLWAISVPPPSHPQLFGRQRQRVPEPCTWDQPVPAQRLWIHRPVFQPKSYCDQKKKRGKHNNCRVLLPLPTPPPPSLQPPPQQ